MTVRQAWEASLIECNKVKAPSILLEDFIYLFNKAIQQYINSVYNRAEYNQQSSDDLNFLQTVCVLDEVERNDQSLGDIIWRFKLPNDYMHLLNCKAEILDYKKKNSKCSSNYTPKEVVQCSRLTADLDAGVINNYYLKPSSKRVYYYIVNRNDSVDTPTNKAMDDKIQEGSYRSVYMDDNENSLNDMNLKDQYDRTSNQSPVFIEIHAGNTTEVTKIQVAYVKSPMYVSMTEEQVYAIKDNTQVLEFPDYICYEIINTFVRLVLENASDPRLQTNIPINQTIGIPANN